MSEKKWLAIIPYIELNFEFVRSRGPGGQNVNRTNSAAVLRWNPSQSTAFTYEQKEILLRKLRLSNDGDLIIRSEEFRDQDQNKKRSLEKLNELIERCFYVPKARKKTKPTKSSQRKRVDEKRHRSYLKSLRKIDE